MGKIFTKARQESMRTWIMFFFALALLTGMFLRKDQIGPYWTMLIGAMLGLSVIVSAVGGVMSTRFKEKHDDQDGSDTSSPKQQPKIQEHGQRASTAEMGDSRVSL